MTHVIFFIAMLFTFPGLNKRLPFYILTFCTLFLFLALRYDYGNDYMSYLNIHTLINASQQAWGNNNILFKYLNLLIPNFYLLIAFISLLYIFSVFYLVKSNVKVNLYWFSILILLLNPYLFLVHLSSIRQTIAICFFVFAIIFLIKRNLVMYTVFVLISFGFHSSALVLLPLYFLINEKKIKKRWFMLIFLFLSIFLGTSLFETLIYKVLEFFPYNYTYYFEQGLQNSLRSTLISSFFFFLILFNINKLEGKEIIYGKLSLIATLISLFAFKLSLITRIGMYFDVFLIVTLPLIFSKIKIKAVRQILFIVIIVIYVLRYVSFFNDPLWIDYYGTYRTILSR